MNRLSTRPAPDGLRENVVVAATAALTCLEASVQSFPYVERKLREALAALSANEGAGA